MPMNIAMHLDEESIDVLLEDQTLHLYSPFNGYEASFRLISFSRNDDEGVTEIDELNEEDDLLLNTEQLQELIKEAVKDGIRAYLESRWN